MLSQTASTFAKGSSKINFTRFLLAIRAASVTASLKILLVPSYSISFPFGRRVIADKALIPTLIINFDQSSPFISRVILQSRPTLLKISRIARISTGVLPSADPIIVSPLPQCRILPVSIKVAPSLVTPAITRSCPDISEIISMFPIPFCKVKILVCWFSSGWICSLTALVWKDFTQMIIKSALPISSGLALTLGFDCHDPEAPSNEIPHSLILAERSLLLSRSQISSLDFVRNAAKRHPIAPGPTTTIFILLLIYVDDTAAIALPSAHRRNTYRRRVMAQRRVYICKYIIQQAPPSY